MKISTASDSSSSRPLNGFNSNLFGAVLSGEATERDEEERVNKCEKGENSGEKKNVPDAAQLSLTKG